MHDQHAPEPVIHSIFVLGDVSLPEALTCQPSYTHPGDRRLDRETITRDLLDKLKGARVRLESSRRLIIDGTLVGTRDFHGLTEEGIMNHFQLVVRTDNGKIHTVVPRPIFVTLRPKRLPFAEAARCHARRIVTNMKWFPTFPELSLTRLSPQPQNDKGVLHINGCYHTTMRAKRHEPLC